MCKRKIRKANIFLQPLIRFWEKSLRNRFQMGFVPLQIFFYCCVCISYPLGSFTSPYDSSGQNLREKINLLELQLDQLLDRQQGERSEFDLIDQKIASLQKQIASLQNKKKEGISTSSIQIQALVKDLQLLKSHIEQHDVLIKQLLDRTDVLEKLIHSQEAKMEQVKKDIHTVIHLLQENGKSDSEERRSHIHKVQAGDTLEKIAKKYNVTVAQLKEWNQLKHDRIKVGQSIKYAADEK